jgi:hypothetical protein
MEFTDGLFRGFKTLYSLLPATNLWCRITEIVLLAHPVKLSRRLACYQVGYWETEPTPESEVATPLVIKVDGLQTQTFYVLIDASITDLAKIEQLCFEDFDNKKVMGRGYLNSMEQTRLIDFYRKRRYPHSIIDTEGRKVDVDGFTHETIYRSDGLNALELISEQGKVLLTKSTPAFNQEYKLNNRWLVETARRYISPNTLKALTTITN